MTVNAELCPVTNCLKLHILLYGTAPGQENLPRTGAVRINENTSDWITVLVGAGSSHGPQCSGLLSYMAT